MAGEGPEHPYPLYSQHVFSEHDESIPLGFPGMAQNYPTRPTGHDVADIVGVDGHVEELPPYTRYADATVPKPISEPVQIAVIPAPLSPIAQQPVSAVDLNTGAARDVGQLDEKNDWKRRARRRVCAGLPLWIVVLALAVIVFAAALGGIIGGVVGVHKGAAAALATRFAKLSTGLSRRLTGVKCCHRFV